jgi:hypothetical protein
VLGLAFAVSMWASIALVIARSAIVPGAVDDRGALVARYAASAADERAAVPTGACPQVTGFDLARLIRGPLPRPIMKKVVQGYEIMCNAYVSELISHLCL